MKKIDAFTNQYKLSKTLQFKLIPYGRTMDNFSEHLLLEQDKELARLYTKVKGYIDDFHRFYIDLALSKLESLDISVFANLYYKSEKSDSEKKQLEEEAASLREQIVKKLTSLPEYEELFSKGMITNLLPSFLDDEEKLSDVKSLSKFSTYFSGFHENRKNIYTSDPKTTAVAYRCINDNLPKFLSIGAQIVKNKILNQKSVLAKIRHKNEFVKEGISLLEEYSNRINPSLDLNEIW